MNYYPYTEPQHSSYYQLDSDDYDIKIRQQPRDALLAQDGKEKNRKPIDPPPIIEVNVRTEADPIRQFLQSPYLFMCCSLIPIDAPEGSSPGETRGLCGTMVSSLHRLKDIDNKDGGFFVFGDLSVKKLGDHRLRFSLFELNKESGNAVFLKSTYSDVFTVLSSKDYPGLDESTQLSRTFADQGVKLRLRKEARNASGAAIGSKRSYSSQAGPSRLATAQHSPTQYQSLGSSFQDFGDHPLKRHRSDEYSPYTGMGRGDMSGSYGGRVTTPRPSLQSPVPSQGSASGSRWQPYYGQGPSSAPAGLGDMTYRVSSAPRLDTPGRLQYPPSLPSQVSQLPSYNSQSAMLRGNEAMYAQQNTPQHSSPSASVHDFPSTPGGSAGRQVLTQGQGYQSPTHGSPQYVVHPAVTGVESSIISSGTANYPYAPQHQYGSMTDSGSYSYNQPSQYRPTYQSLPSNMGRGGPPTSSSLLQQPLTSTLPHRGQDPSSVYNPGNPLQQSHSYGELPQGYSSAYEQQQRTEYPTPTTQSGSW